MGVKDIKDLDKKIDQLRSEKGLTDTAILDALGRRDKDFSTRVDKARGAFGNEGASLTNDRDLLNFVSEKFTGRTPTVPSVAEQEEVKKPGIVESIAKPFTKGLASLANLGETAFDLVRGDTEGAAEAIKKERDFGVFGTARPIGLKQETGERLGTGEFLRDVAGTGAEIASFIAPGSLATKGVAKGAFPTVKALAGAGAVSGGLSGLGVGLQDQDQNALGVLGSTLQGAAIGGVAGPVLGKGLQGIASIPRAVSGITGTSGRIGAGIAGQTTGKGGELIEEAFDIFRRGSTSEVDTVNKFMRISKEDAEASTTDFLTRVVQGVRKLRDEAGQNYQKQLQKIAGEAGDIKKIIEIEDVQKEFIDELTSQTGFRVKITPEGKLDFSSSTIGNNADKKAIQEVFDKLSRWGEDPNDLTPLGLDAFKRQVDDLFLEGKESSALIGSLISSVDRKLKKDVPGYAKMTADYAQMKELLADIKNSLSVGSTIKNKETALNKVLNVFRRADNEERQRITRALEEYIDGDFRAEIVGRNLRLLQSEALGGKLSSMALGGAIFGMFNPSTFGILALTSPRTVGEMIKVLALTGKTKDKLFQKTLQLFGGTPENINKINKVFQKAKGTVPVKGSVGLSNILIKDGNEEEVIEE